MTAVRTYSFNLLYIFLPRTTPLRLCILHVWFPELNSQVLWKGLVNPAGSFHRTDSAAVAMMEDTEMR